MSVTRSGCVGRVCVGVWSWEVAGCAYVCVVMGKWQGGRKEAG